MCFYFACTLSCVLNSPATVTAYMLLCLWDVVEEYELGYYAGIEINAISQDGKYCAFSNDAWFWLEQQGGELEWIKHDEERRIV